MKRILPVVLACALVSAARVAHACTTFCLDKGSSLVFGKNYDWGVEDGILVVNRRDVEKTAFTTDHPARWKARFGSVTFNQYGREFPSGGMNERGLVVELMWLDDTRYPDPDDRGALPTLQWIQYQLDTSANVEDVVASDVAIRIGSGATARIHFLIADATGACASIEFLDGKMVVHRGKEMPYRALTNDTYARSLEYLRGGGSRAGQSSLSRFARAADRAKNSAARGAATIGAAFDLLAEVAQGDYTQWSIVYDIGKQRVLFRTRLNPRIRWINLASLDFACTAPVRGVDLNAALAGDLSRLLTDLTYRRNLELVNTSFTKTEFLRAVPLESREEMARYPDGMKCAPARP